MFMLCLGALPAGITAQDAVVPAADSYGGLQADSLAPDDVRLTVLAILGEQEQALDGWLNRRRQTLDDQGRRYVVDLRLQTVETTLRARREANALIGLSVAWRSVILRDELLRQAGSDNADALRDGMAPILAATRRRLEETAYRGLAARPFRRLKAELEGTAGRVAAGDATVLATWDALLSATRLESVLDISLSPFTALRGIGKSGDALADLNGTGQRGLDLAERYPDLMRWQISLAAMDVSELEAVRQALADLHAITDTAHEAAQTARTLPEDLRQQAERLLNASTPVQGELRSTLDHLAASARALEGAAHAVAGTVTAVSALAERFRPAGSTVQPTGEPFRIQDYTAACQAAEHTAEAMTRLLAEADAVQRSPAAAEHVRAIGAFADAYLQRAAETGNRAIDRAHAALCSLIIWSLLGFLVVGVTLLFLARRIFRTGLPHHD